MILHAYTKVVEAGCGKMSARRHVYSGLRLTKDTPRRRAISAVGTLAGLMACQRTSVRRCTFSGSPPIRGMPAPRNLWQHLTRTVAAALLPKDVREAARLFRLAADQGNAFAQCYLGAYFAHGLGGLRKDEGEAIRLSFRLAADKLDDSGRSLFSFVCSSGLVGLPKGDREAMRLFELATNQGYATGAA